MLKESICQKEVVFRREIDQMVAVVIDFVALCEMADNFWELSIVRCLSVCIKSDDSNGVSFLLLKCFLKIIVENLKVLFILIEGKTFLPLSPTL